jgi:riboflavin synthase
VQRGEQRGVWQQRRARSWEAEHRTWQQRGGYDGYRIPQDRYRRYFGSRHPFRIYRYPVVLYDGYPRFQYGGFWFSLMDPWPEYWSDDWWEADVSDETFARTNLGALSSGDLVNLERPVRLADRLGGHLVQGHVDAVGEIVEPTPELQVRMPADLLRYVVEKGSITVDGVSLTVVKPLDDGFTVAVIPHTADVTTLGHKGRGDPVNLEVDVMAKYAERLLEAHTEPAAGGGR